MAVALGRQGHVDTNVSFAEFFRLDHTLVMRFIAQCPTVQAGPLIAENGSGTFALGHGHRAAAETEIVVAVGSRHGDYPTMIIAERWHHLALRMTADVHQLTFEPYLDGTLLGPGLKVSRGDPELPRGTLRFGQCTTGRSLPGGGAQFFGFIDDVGIFSRALTSAEIAQLGSGCSRLIGNESDLLTGFGFAADRVSPRLARGVTLYGAARLVTTSPTRNSAADAALLTRPA